MKKIVTSVTFFLICIIMNAQKDTLYFDKHWKETSVENALFYRPIPLAKVGDVYHLKDYYINGNLQMDGFYSNLEEEIFHGVTTWYREDGTKKEAVTFENGIKNGLVTNYFEDGTIRNSCVYKNDNPFEGVEDNYVDSHNTRFNIYKEGQKVGGYELYNNSQQIAYKEIRGEDRILIKKTYYDINGKEIGELTFGNQGEPYNGTKVEFSRLVGDGYGRMFQEKLSDKNEYTNYVKGKKHGPFFESFGDPLIEVSGNYYEDKMEGKIVFDMTENGETFVCEYKNGKPIEGAVVSHNKITQYLHGKKHFIETLNFEQLVYGEFDKITRTFDHGILEGEITYFLKEKIVGNGIYKNGDPIDGIFFNGIDSVNNDEEYKIVLDQGILIQKTYYMLNHKVQDTYENEMIVERISYDRLNGVNTKGIFLNGKPHEGTIFTFDEGMTESDFVEYMQMSCLGYDKSYRYTNYKNGLKEGLETIVSFPTCQITATEIIYKSNLPISITTPELDFLKGKKVTGTYKNGVPFSGQFFTRWAISSLSTYEDGNILTIKYFSIDVETKLVAEIIYKDGKPYEGQQLERYFTDFHQHFYKKGKKIKTRIYPFFNSHPDAGTSWVQDSRLDGGYFVAASLIQNLPAAEIYYTANGFETKPIDGFPNGPKLKVDFSNDTKSSGSATSNDFYSLQFDKGKIVHFQDQEPNEFDDHTSYQQTIGFDSENRLYNTISGNGYFTQWISHDPFPEQPDFKDFFYLVSRVGRNSTMQYYLKAGEPPFASYEIPADGKTNGYLIFEDYESNLFGLNLYKDGKLISEQQQLTIPEILKIVKIK